MMTGKETWSYHNSGNGISLCVHHGSVDIETRIIPSGDGLAFQGRSVHKNKYGEITKITPWETTGVLQ